MCVGASRSDPLKRRTKRQGVIKRRSASYSPQSAKGVRKISVGTIGTTTDTEVERRMKGTRRRRPPARGKPGVCRGLAAGGRHGREGEPEEEEEDDEEEEEDTRGADGDGTGRFGLLAQK